MQSSGDSNADVAYIQREIRALQAAQRRVAATTKIYAVPFSHTYTALPAQIVVEFTPDNTSYTNYFSRADIDGDSNVYSVNSPYFSHPASPTTIIFPAIGNGETPYETHGIFYSSVPGTVVVS